MFFLCEGCSESHSMSPCWSVDGLVYFFRRNQFSILSFWEKKMNHNRLEGLATWNDKIRFLFILGLLHLEGYCFVHYAQIPHANITEFIFNFEFKWILNELKMNKNFAAWHISVCADKSLIRDKTVTEIVLLLCVSICSSACSQSMFCCCHNEVQLHL